jgi:hypothetical protein
MVSCRTIRYVLYIVFLAIDTGMDFLLVLYKVE